MAGSQRRLFLLAVLSLVMGVMGVARAQPQIEDVFQNAVACAVLEPLLADMPVEPVFASDSNECTVSVPDDNPDQRYFIDTDCTDPLNFKPTTLLSHCSLLLDSSALGEGEGITEPVWTLPPGTRLDLGARALDGVGQPYLQRHVYRSIATAGGTCNLEMRVYSANPGRAGQSSLLALHGGSWSSRGFGFFGLELTVPHYTDKGFVVYVPFYRLLGSSDGSPACQNATIEQIVDDAEAALEWVRDNAANFGSTSKPVVFGQSAGAHLATSLAINQSEFVAGGILFYPPTDFTDFALRAQAGVYNNPQGLGILDKVIGVSAADADISTSPIPENSFPIRVVESDLNIPPLIMVHGVADELVEVRQSVRLCDALAGRELLDLNSAIDPLTGLRELMPCGAESQLQLIKEGQHALDVCLADAPIPTDLCPSGSRDSRQEVSLAIADTVNFAVSVAAGESPQAGQSGSSGGAFAPISVAGLLLLALRRCFRMAIRHRYCSLS